MSRMSVEEVLAGFKSIEEGKAVLRELVMGAVPKRAVDPSGDDLTEYGEAWNEAIDTITKNLEAIFKESTHEEA